MRPGRIWMPAAVVLFVMLSITSASATGRAAGRPNVLVIISDDERFGTFNVMPRTRSELVNKGVFFPHAYGTTPLCCPGRASIYTGRYAHNHRVWRNAEAGWRRLRTRTTLQRYLQRAGYRTAIVGKYFNDWDLGKRPPWFDRWWVFSPGDSGAGGYYDTRWNLNGRMRSVHEYSTDFAADRAVEFIRSAEHHDRRPWLLYASPFAPHEPATPAPRDANAGVPRFRSNPAVRESDRSDKPPYARRSDLTLDRTLGSVPTNSVPSRPSTTWCLDPSVHWARRVRSVGPSSCSCPTTASSGRNTGSSARVRPIGKACGYRSSCAGPVIFGRAGPTAERPPTSTSRRRSWMRQASGSPNERRWMGGHCSIGGIAECV